MNTNNLSNALEELNEHMENFIQKNKNINNNNINNQSETNNMNYNYNNENINIKKLPLSKPLSNQEYKTDSQDFSKFIRSGEEKILTKSINEKDEASGGFLIPQQITTRIFDKLKYLSPMRSIAKIMKISTNSIDIIVDTDIPEAEWTNDAYKNETEAHQFEKVHIPVHEIYAKPKIDQKLLEDSEIDVEKWLVNKIAEKIAILENKAFINGDGEGKPFGFINCKTDSAPIRDFGILQHFKTSAKGALPNDTEKIINILIDMTCSLKPEYVKNAKWVMHTSVFSEIRKLKDEDGRFLWQPSLSEGTPSTLLGYPVIIDNDMPQIIKDVESISLAFGDFSTGYQIVDRQNLRIIRDPYTSKPFVEFFVSKRTGGNVIDYDAIKVLKFAE